MSKWPSPSRRGCGQRRPLDQLQHQCPRALGFLDAVDGRDARVVEAGENLGFPLESCETVKISRERFEEDLQGDIAVELYDPALVAGPC